jgi:hypothetical protein
MSDQGDVTTLSNFDHTNIVIEFKINKDYNANMICINKIEMGQKQCQDLEKAKSKEQEKEKLYKSYLNSQKKHFIKKNYY